MRTAFVADAVRATLSTLRRACFPKSNVCGISINGTDERIYHFHGIVIPAQAGIQKSLKLLDARRRGHDGNLKAFRDSLNNTEKINVAVQQGK